jgi:hypothetical protein
MKASRKSECSMPETGPIAPERTLVAVRAMVPVTQMPPKSADPILAKPCATSSHAGAVTPPRHAIGDHG